MNNNNNGHHIAGVCKPLYRAGYDTKVHKPRVNKTIHIVREHKTPDSVHVHTD